MTCRALRTGREPVEFTCCECDRDIVSFWRNRPPGLHLCTLCIDLPGWFRDPAIRARLDPDHDGRDPAEAEEA